VARNADMLRANIEKCEHATTEALFAEAPGLCDYIWEGWEGLMSLRTMVDNLLLHRVVCHSTRHALYCVVCPSTLHVLYHMSQYSSCIALYALQLVLVNDVLYCIDLVTI
jgi:hypothetical protein